MNKKAVNIDAVIMELMHNGKYKDYTVHSIGEGVEYFTIYVEIDGIIYPIHVTKIDTYTNTMLNIDRAINIIKSKEPEMFLYLKQRIDKLEQKLTEISLQNNRDNVSDIKMKVLKEVLNVINDYNE